MKLWGGRFAGKTDSLMDDFHSSISFDQRLYRQDITGSMAHARMLGEKGIISREEADILITGLKGILADIEAGLIQFEVDAEDIHMNIEKILTQRVGDAGKKLHTARSRNDQVALDLRLYMKDGIRETAELLGTLMETLLELASRHLLTVMPGYTHLQKAQPITLGHHLMAYFQMFARDADRLRDCFRRTDVMPLGSGALAGTTFDIDREMVCEELGFRAITANSLDGVADRDFAVEFCGAASMIMMHLSRLSEEIVLWSSHEFKFITLDDGFSTGSSIMPQKKNPDVAELVRGKTGRVYGDLIGLLTVLKGIPLAYNKDMQEDKEAIFDALDTVKKCLSIYPPMLATMKVNKDVMRAGAKGGFINATDAADYLAARGVPFREAHGVVGRLVLYCEAENKSLEDLSLSELQGFSPVFDEDVYQFIAVDKCVEARKVTGGPAPQAVEYAIAQGKELLAEVKGW